MITRRKKRTARIGVYAIGHETYWGQFEGLLERLMEYHEDFKTMVAQNDVEIVDFGMVDTSEGAYAALTKMQGAGLDLLFCNMVTYGISSTFAPIIRDLNVPVVLVALQPLASMGYKDANSRRQLENDNICAVPEFTGVAVRMGKQVADVVLGTLYKDAEAAAHVAEWCNIAKVLHDLKGARVALMGHVLESMYDMHADPTAISKAFGLHVPLLEVDDVVALYRQIKEEDVEAKIQLIRQNFDMPDPKSDPVTRKLTEEDLVQAAKSAVALDMFIEKYNLTGLAYYYEGEEGSLQRQVSSSFIVGNSILNAQGVPMCGEFDIKTCIAMLIMDRLDIGGSFAEFHPFDFEDDFILVGHDGPHHIAIADGKPVLRSLTKYHGKHGSGASVEFKIKAGPITIMGITQDADGEFRFIIGEGQSKQGEIPPTGKTNTRGHFAPTTKEFIKKWVMMGPTHHYALGIGHHADTIAKIAAVLGIRYNIVRG